VKIRGYRVELAEIDLASTASPGVVDATASVVKNRRGEDQLVGYLILKEPTQFNQQVVEKYLEVKLPDYMVPRHYVVLDAFPTLPTGKTDRKGLPNPFERAEWRSRTAPLHVAPEAQEIVDLFEELLQVGNIDVDSDFMKAGGDSLLTAVLLCRIHERFDVEVSIGDFSESPTPRNLAAFIRMAVETGGGRRSVRKATYEKTDLFSPARSESHIEPVCTVAPSRFAARAAHTDTMHAAPPSSGKKNLVIICAGGLGREVFTWAAQAIAAGAPWRIKGFLDSRADALDGYKHECRIIGDVDGYQIDEDDVFVGAIGNPHDKVRC
jgi:acyl carrier protein